MGLRSQERLHQEPGDMTCQEALSLLYDYLDKEVSEVDFKAVKEHISRCNHCSEIYRLEQAVDDFIRAKANHEEENLTPDLESLRSRVVVELNRCDDEGSGARGRPPFEFAAKTLVAAASLVLLLGAAYYLSGFYQHWQEYHHWESAHRAAMTDIDSFADANATSQTVTYVGAELGYQLHPQVGRFELLGARTTEFNDTPTAHAVYRFEEQVVSVFLCDCHQYVLPESFSDSTVVTGERTFHDHTCPGCRLCSHTDGDALVITATTVEGLDLHQFVPGQSRPVFGGVGIF